MPKEQVTLTDMIKQCYQAAALNPGTPAREQLSGGLRISVMMVRVNGQPDRFKLQLDRQGGVPPSLKEWQTVLENWPWHVDTSHQPARSYMVGDVPPRVQG